MLQDLVSNQKPMAVPFISDETYDGKVPNLDFSNYYLHDEHAGNFLIVF